MSRLENVTPINIYAYDVDYMGVVHNIVYLRWLETIRTDFLDEYYSITDSLETGICPIIAKTEMKYFRPLRITDKPLAYFKLEEMGRSKWVISFEIKVGSELCFRTDQVGMFYDIHKKKPAKTPEHIRKIFLQELEAQSSES